LKKEITMQSGMRPIHPGEILKQELDELAHSQFIACAARPGAFQFTLELVRFQSGMKGICRQEISRQLQYLQQWQGLSG
jgi:hypothetical protein